MNKSEKAVNIFNEGFNCSQAVLSAYSEQYSLDEMTAKKLAGAFGGGIARNSQICGAVSGALMVIGLRDWNNDLTPGEAKTNVYNKSNKFIQEFKALHKSINCTELLGCDLGTEEGRKKANDKNTSKNICEKLVRDSAEILEKLL